VCVLGLGLIGGSVLRAATAAGRTAWGATASTADAEAASADGFTVEATLHDALRRAGEQDALVVIAVPLPAVADVLRSVATTAPSCRLTDVVSVKQPVTSAVRELAPSARYVGGHPMAGTAASGWQAGSAKLFSDAPWVVSTEDDVDREVWADVARLALDAGARVVPASAAEHDAAVARVSHLPHMLAAVLAAVGADGGPLALALAAGSFTDGTRVAGSRPELLDVIDDALLRLGGARDSLASTGRLESIVHDGHQARRAWQLEHERRREPVRIDLAAPGAVAQLRALGHGGGWLTALNGTLALGLR
jgi:prephenate dehydrogenase